eukprot:jgi/Mesvir1/18945/Mv18916-RA.1
MKVIVTGGCGFLGRRLLSALLERGNLVNSEGREEQIDEIIVVDAIIDEKLASTRVRLVQGDISGLHGVLPSLIDDQVGSIFHLAAVVSSQAEQDYDLGMRVNIDGLRAVIDSCRARETSTGPSAKPPRLVFTSSVAVFGDSPPVVTDATPATPQSSYGTEKAVGELLINDATRKGFLDGRVVRLPTIVVRPGKPNKAASSFASSILREPLHGLPAVCPVEGTVPLWVLSPDRAIDALIHAHNLPGERLGRQRTINLPGISVTVEEMVNALARAGGDTSLIRWERDEHIEKIVTSWPGKIETERGLELGFVADRDIDSIITCFLRSEGL